MRQLMLPTLLLLTNVSLAGDYRPPADVPKTGIGFRGDGLGVYPGKPPTEFDEATGKNILWKAPLPNWGYNSPVPVGNRVLFVSEPGWQATWPELCCFDADSGALVWKVPVDPLDSFPDITPAQRKAATDAVEAIYGQGRTAYRICSPLMAIGSVKSDHPAMIKANEALKAQGMTMESYTPGYGLLRKLQYTDDRKKGWEKTIKPFGLQPECTWQRFGRARVGIAFPTPVTDGQRVWVMTYHGTVACFDVATGKRVWSAATGFKGHHGLMASPRLYGDLLVAAFIDTNAFDPLVIGYDKNTGAVRWKVVATKSAFDNKQRASRPGGSVVIMSVGKTDVALISSGRVIRLPDGHLYETGIDKICGTYAVDDENDIVFSTGHVDGQSLRTAVKLTLEGDKLVATDRYAYAGSYGPLSAVLVAGKVWTSGMQLDALTGLWAGTTKPDEKPKSRNTAPRSNHLMLAANGHLYGLDEVKTRTEKGKPDRLTAVCEVFTDAGKLVSSNTLQPTSHEGVEKWIAQGWGEGPSFSYACAMNIGGDRLYLCSDDQLYCIGSKQ